MGASGAFEQRHAVHTDIFHPAWQGRVQTTHSCMRHVPKSLPEDREDVSWPGGSARASCVLVVRASRAWGSLSSSWNFAGPGGAQTLPTSTLLARKYRTEQAGTTKRGRATSFILA